MAHAIVLAKRKFRKQEAHKNFEDQKNRLEAHFVVLEANKKFGGKINRLEALSIIVLEAKKKFGDKTK